ncbi:MAG: hypothetical protein QOI06_2282 [Nocardioidaceae bacterium]|jgi:hypothetical protein|nr:hypothetical protein [Nocardioidaceae bacterium]
MSDLRTLPDPALPVLSLDERPGELRETPDRVKRVTIAALAIGAACFAIIFSTRITDPDTWWHLRLGEKFQSGWSLSHPGQLSSFAHQSWIPTEWLSEVVASDVNNVFGLRGVAWLTGVGVLALAAALFAACRQEGTVVAAAFSVFAAMFGIAATIGPRPQLVSFVLLALYMGTWLRTMRDLRPRWWLIPLSGVWACSHGMWFTGVLTGLAVVFGLLLDGRLASKQAIRLLLVPFLSVCAAAVTPVGPRLLLAPLSSHSLAPFVTEWQPPDFRTLCPLVTALMLVAVAMTWSRGMQTSWSHVFLFVIACGWTVLSARTVSLGAIMAAPLLAASIHRWMTTGAVEPVKRPERLWAVACVATVVLFLTILAPFRPSPDPHMPPKVEAALARLPNGTVIFNEYTLGGWLEWKHRNVIPVIDGMASPYGSTYLSKYAAARKLEPGWQTFVRGTAAHYALLYRSTPLEAELQTYLGWRPVAQSPSEVLLVHPGA